MAGIEAALCDESTVEAIERAEAALATAISARKRAEAALACEALNGDLEDLCGEAVVAMYEAAAEGAPHHEQMRAAYAAINHYLRALRAIQLSKTAQRTTYIEDEAGEICSVSAGIDAILDGEAANALMDMLCASLMQSDYAILRAYLRGSSASQIAAARGVYPSTITRALERIRAEAAEAMANDYYFSALIPSAYCK